MLTSGLNKNLKHRYQEAQNNKDWSAAGRVKEIEQVCHEYENNKIREKMKLGQPLEDIQAQILKFADPTEKVTVVDSVGQQKLIKSVFQHGLPSYKFQQILEQQRLRESIPRN